jgi:hypothetical protein
MSDFKNKDEGKKLKKNDELESTGADLTEGDSDESAKGDRTKLNKRFKKPLKDIKKPPVREKYR